MNLFIADRGRVAILDEIEVLKSSDKIEEKTFDELIKIIEDSNILNHYKEFVYYYAKNWHNNMIIFNYKKFAPDKFTP